MSENKGTIDIGKIEEYKEKGYKEVSSKVRIPSKYNTDFDFPEDKWKIIEYRYKYTGEERYWDITSYAILKYDDNLNTFNNESWLAFARNYHSLGDDLLAYTIQNGKEFIITSSDYQYLTICNLTDREIKSYAYGDPDHGNGFCPVSVEFYINEDSTNELKVYGCFWACPYETLIIKNVNLEDLSESYNIKNKDIQRIDEEYDEEEYNPTELLSSEEIDKFDNMTLDEMSIYSTIQIIKDDKYGTLSDQYKEYFNNIILKALMYYYDNVL